ncbi:MAG: hypothetical protein WC879_14210 [Melioribacteraceae bacterium]
MIGYRFLEFIPSCQGDDPFELLLPIFIQLLNDPSDDESEQNDEGGYI